MKAIIFIFYLLIASFEALSQSEINILEVETVDAGDGRLCYRYKGNKKLPEGLVRLINVADSGYIETVFDEKGFVSGQWKKAVGKVLLAEGEYKDGFPDGVFRTYSTDGERIVEENVYIKGKKDGVWKFYRPDGNLREVREFKEDKACGKWKTFYPDGKPESEKSYKEGLDEGVDRKYDENGKLRRDIKYVAGKKVGKAFEIVSNSKGEVSITAYYDKNGRRDGDYCELFSDGSVREKGKYVNGKKQGLWVYGSPNGGKLCEEKYKDGMLIEKTSVAKTLDTISDEK
ncbi:MAG: hypothetical protein LBC98_04405 [Prevotellaceae bacterium]|nr:hypothetical protein [Prevotellaceae bacterium]